VGGSRDPPMRWAEGRPAHLARENTTMTTLRQTEANRLNARNSTGPRSAEGKERTRRNALRHGLAGDGVVLPDEEAAAVLERSVEWSNTLEPTNSCEIWLAEQIALESIRIDTARHHETVLRGMAVERASSCWDDDRRASVSELGARLGEQPEAVSARLRLSSQGCAWLIERWEGLRHVSEGGGEWTNTQHALALDLLGTPRSARTLPTPLEPAPGQDRAAVCLAVAQAEIAALAERKASVLDALDQGERAAAELGLGTEIPRSLTLVRRYAAACMRRFQWCWNQFQKDRHAQKKEIPVYHPPSDSSWDASTESDWREALVERLKERPLCWSTPFIGSHLLDDEDEPAGVETIDVRIVPEAAESWDAEPTDAPESVLAESPGPGASKSRAERRKRRRPK
jgi:hypothetical protein